MSLLLQLTINALIAGSIYALVASGFSLIYGTAKFIHFAHGISVSIGAYLLYWLFNLLGITFYVSVFLTIVLTAGIGLGMYLWVYKPLEKRKATNVILLMASIALLILFENVILAIFGADVKTIGYLKVAKGLEIFGAIITPLQIVIILASIVLFVGLTILMKKSKFGKQVRAVADNPGLAEVVGIDSNKVIALSFLIGSAIAGVAGILVALEQNLSHTMGTNLMVKGFTGAVVGGLSSVPASVLGSYILGLAENYGIWYLPSGYKDAIAFILLFLFLLFKPEGLFGKKRGVR